MNYLTSFLEQVRNSEHLGKGTDKTDKSTQGATEAALTSVPATVEATTATSITMAFDDPMGEALWPTCDDCGRPTVIALVTDYGARYCRECVFPSATTTPKPQAVPVQSDTQGELVV
jgi:hypothetical protein